MNCRYRAEAKLKKLPHTWEGVFGKPSHNTGKSLCYYLLPCIFDEIRKVKIQSIVYCHPSSNCLNETDESG